MNEGMKPCGCLSEGGKSDAGENPLRRHAEPAPFPVVTARPRVVVCECCRMDGVGVGQLLAAQDLEAIVVSPSEDLIEEIVQRPADVVVFTMCGYQEEHFGLLRLLRRIKPELPTIVLATDSSLAAERQVRDLKPVYYGISPLDPTEVLQAVRSAIGSHRHVKNR